MHYRDSDFVEILSTFDPFLMSFVKSLLEGEGIDYYFKGEYSSLIEPVHPARLMVKREDEERAREILKEVLSP